MRTAVKIDIKNRQASFNYELLDRYNAGIVLLGTEIKSIREGKAGLADAYCTFIGEELWVQHMHIAAYRLGTAYNHEAQRSRKLLLTKRELRKLSRATKESGLTIIPTRLYIDEKGFAKLEIALARGKKNYDKRESIKEREDRRQIDRALKGSH
ncbi:MAG: SsrA-binding protein SmpB [Prevotellaceae bacterium]|jgi:SsrA-binding protein|nr:SsrA-binding protein SmpB [Prevotellaceae bacterium]